MMLSLFACYSAAGKVEIESKPEKRKISKIVLYTYYKTDYDSLPNKFYLYKRDTLYFDMDKKILKQVGLWFKFDKEYPDSVSRQVASSEYAIKYDENGHKTEVEYYRVYKKDGDITERSEYEKYGARYMDAKSVYTYDEKGNNTRLDYYIKNDGEDLKLSSKHMYIYDEKNKLAEEAIYSGRGDLYQKYVYHYNDKGVKQSKDQYSVNDSIVSFRLKEQYAYDGHGRVQTEGYVNELGEVFSEVKYDYVDNSERHWIKELSYKDGNLLEVKTREIEYYKNGNEIADSLINNELWWKIEPLIAARGSDGVYALYLYDDGYFVEHNVAQINGKESTRKGTYHYQPETGKVFLTYNDRSGEEYVFYNPHYVNEGTLKDPAKLIWRSMVSVEKIEKGKRPKPWINNL